MILTHDLVGTDGPVVLLLHSSVCDRRMWDPQMAALTAAGYRVLRADFRGYGDTPVPAGPYNPADDVRDLLDHLGLDQVAVVGASMGGRIAAEVAARWPQRVHTAVLACAGWAGYEPTAAVLAFEMRENALLEGGDVDSAVELNLGTWLGPRAGAETLARVGRMQRHNFEVQRGAPDVAVTPADFDLRRVTARTLVLSGAYDMDYFQLIALSLAQTIPGAGHVHLDWAGHLPSIEDPEAFNPVMLDWLAGR